MYPPFLQTKEHQEVLILNNNKQFLTMHFWVIWFLSKKQTILIKLTHLLCLTGYQSTISWFIVLYKSRCILFRLTILSTLST